MSSVDDLPQLARKQQPVKQVERQAGKVKQAEPEVQAETALLEVPMTSQPLGHIKKRYDVYFNGQQATTLRRIAWGLSQQSAKLKNGKIVDSGTDALRWMLENVSK